jgi:hypothetical protein
MTESKRAYSDEVLAAVDSGRKIEAIKRLREEAGLGLKEANHEIEALARERRGDPSVAANMPEEGGAGGVVKLLLLIGAILAVYFYFFAP